LDKFGWTLHIGTGKFSGHMEYFADIWDSLFMAVWYILCPFGTFLSGFGSMDQEKSGNPDPYIKCCTIDNNILPKER
jgi:hypothetical protein